MDNLFEEFFFQSFIGGTIILSYLDPISVIELLSVNKLFLENTLLWDLAMKQYDLNENTIEFIPIPREKLKFCSKIIINIISSTIFSFFLFYFITITNCD